MPKTSEPRTRGVFRRLVSRRSASFGAMLRTGGAAALSQLIVLATMPIASRLFDETAFGILGLMMGLANILVITNHFGFIDAIVATDSDDDADTLLQLIIGLCAAGAVLNVLLVLGAINFDVLGYGKLPLWVAGFVVVQSATITLALAFQQRLVRTQNYSSLAGSHLALGGGRGGGQIIFGLLLPNSFGLLSAEFFSRLVTLAYLVARTPRGLWNMTGKANNMIRLARLFTNFAALRASGIFLNAVNLALPAIIVSRHFSIEDVGILSFALVLIYAPIGLIQKAIGDVFTGTYRAALDQSAFQARHVLRQMTSILVGIAVVFGVLAYTLGEPLFALIFGANWTASGRTVELLSPMIALMVLVVPLSTSLNILKRADIAVMFNLARLCGLSLLLWGAGAFSYTQVIAAISAVGCVAYIGYGIAIYRLNMTRIAQMKG